jgi:hypothetical protein
MSLKRQKELIELSIDLGENIPGLNVDKIVENLAKNSEEIKAQDKIIQEEVDENIERGMDKNEAEKEGKKKLKEAIQKFKDSIREVVIEQIAIIKQQFKIFKEGLQRIPADVKAAIANIALPPAISAPPAAPNPIYALNLVKTTKNALAGTLAIMIAAFTTVLIASTKISFVLPKPVLSLYEKIKITAQTINTIPA